SVSENLRLLYVALTRARHRCIVYWGALQAFDESALAYLLYGPSEASADGTSVKKADDSALVAPLQALHEADVGMRLVIEQPLSLDSETAATTPAEPPDDKPSHFPTPLVARLAETRVQRWLRTASFTELARNAPSTFTTGSS